MVVMEANAPVGSFYGLENLGVAIAERVGRPTILEVDVAIAVEIPDEISFGFVKNNLPNGAETAPSGTLQMMLETLGLTGQVRVFPSDRAALDYFAVERDDVTTPGAWYDTPRPSGSAGAQPTHGIRPCL